MGQFVFLFTLMRPHSFSPSSEFMGWSIEAKCKPVKKYKRAHDKCTSKPMKSPYGVGRYCNMAVSPTRSHLLWVGSNQKCYLLQGNIQKERNIPVMNLAENIIPSLPFHISWRHVLCSVSLLRGASENLFYFEKLR